MGSVVVDGHILHFHFSSNLDPDKKVLLSPKLDERQDAVDRDDLYENCKCDEEED